MWVFIRPQGGQDCYLLTCEIRGCVEYCPIHRFDGMDQIPLHQSGTLRRMKKRTEGCKNSARVENSSLARVEGLWRISRNEFGKRLH